MALAVTNRWFSVWAGGEQVFSRKVPANAVQPWGSGGVVTGCDDWTLGCCSWSGRFNRWNMRCVAVGMTFSTYGTSRLESRETLLHLAGSVFGRRAFLVTKEQSQKS